MYIDSLAFENEFGIDIDYAMLVKTYGESTEQKIEKSIARLGTSAVPKPRSRAIPIRNIFQHPTWSVRI
jgi:hypothetical protein